MCHVESTWTKAGVDRVPEFYVACIMGNIANNILSSIEQHNNDEAKLICEKINSMLGEYTEQLGSLTPSEVDFEEEGFL